MERRTFTVSIDKSLQDSFREKCKNDGIKYNEVIEALLQAYINGTVKVNVKTTYTVISNDKDL